KITIGGNICANIIYREAVLPFLLTDTRVLLATKKGLQEKVMTELFQERLKLDDGELLLQFKTDLAALKYPYFVVKKRRQWGVGYPLITVAAIQCEGKINLAFSGLCPYPFRSYDMENALNNEDKSV